MWAAGWDLSSSPDSLRMWAKWSFHTARGPALSRTGKPRKRSQIEVISFYDLALEVTQHHSVLLMEQSLPTQVQWEAKRLLLFRQMVMFWKSLLLWLCLENTICWNVLFSSQPERDTCHIPKSLLSLR